MFGIGISDSTTYYKYIPNKNCHQKKNMTAGEIEIKYKVTLNHLIY